MVGYGAIYSYAAFAEEIAAEFGSSRSSTTLVFVLSGSSCFFISAISGPMADRAGSRVVAAAGMVLVGLGLIVAASAKSLLQVYIGYGLLVGLGAGFAYVPAVAAVQRWFVQHRGLATGIAVSGVGLGTALVPPATELLSLIGDWRASFLVSGMFAGTVGIGGALLLAPLPERRGLAPEGIQISDLTAGVPHVVKAPLLPAGLRTHAFALAYAGTLLVSLPVTLPYAMLVATARDLGINLRDAVVLLSLVGLSSIAGRFAIGALADAVGRRTTFLVCCGGLGATMLLWAGATNSQVLQTFALGFGVLHGGFVALLPVFATDSFGRHSAGAVIGVLYTSRGIALLGGPPALVLGVDTLGSPSVPLAAAAAAGMLGTLLLARLRPTPP
jgi:MFS family permease